MIIYKNLRFCHLCTKIEDKKIKKKKLLIY